MDTSTQKRASKEKDIERTKNIKNDRQIKRMCKIVNPYEEISQSFIDRDAYEILILNKDCSTQANQEYWKHSRRKL